MEDATAGGARIVLRPLRLAGAVASVAGLAVVAPGGLALLGFLGVVIVTHELGHFLVARRTGMRPTELFWGFGPVVAAVEVGGCRYGLKALWLGGYVKLEGMTPRSILPERFEEGGTFRAASHRARLATILAGPAVNLATAVVAFAVAAALADGRTWSAALATGAGDAWFVVSTTGEALWIWITQLGTYLDAMTSRSGGTEVPVRFLSPVGQAGVSSQAIEAGLGPSLQWLGVLAAAIGAVNLLPLPPLDGSHAAVAATEWVAQRLRRDRTLRLDVHHLNPLAWTTVAVLVALSLSALVLDLRDVL